MKKKLLYAGGIIAAIIVIVIIGLTIFVKSYLKSDRLKAVIVPKIEDLTGRKASIDNIYVSLFKGIDVQGIRLMNREGTGDFLNIREFVLDYSLLPLLHKQLVINKVEVVSPSVALVRRKDGTYNFSDILEKAKAGNKESKPSDGQGLPFSIVTDKVAVRDANMTFTDEEGAIPAVSLSSDIDLRVVAEKGATPVITGKVDVKELTMKMGENEISSAGTIGLDKDAITFDLSSKVGKDTIHFSGNARDYMTAPVVKLDATANELDLDKLLALSGGSKDSRGERRTDPGKAEKTPSGKSAVGKKTGVSASGKIKVASATYGDYLLRDFTAHYSYAKDRVTVDPVSMGISGGSGARIAGTVKAGLKFSLASGGSAADSIKKSLAGNATVDLNKCEVKKTKITDAIALFTGIKEIANPRFDKVNFIFTIGHQEIDLKGLMSSALLNLDPAGTVGFDKRIDVATDLKVAPSLAGGLTPSAIATYVKDDKGWTVIPLRITGTTDKPSVGLNKAKVIKGVEKGIKKEIEKGLFKGLFGK